MTAPVVPSNLGDKDRARSERGDSARIEELETLCAELYQVIGSLACLGGVFDHPDVQNALDNASSHTLTHKDLLPWPRDDALAKRINDALKDDETPATNGSGSSESARLQAMEDALTVSAHEMEQALQVAGAGFHLCGENMEGLRRAIKMIEATGLPKD